MSKEGVTLSQKAYERIKTGILSLEFPPGSVLQERTLAEMLGISRTPLREALHTLMREKWLSVAARSYSRVRDVHLVDLRELYEVREILETSALSLLVTRGLYRECALLLEEQHEKMQQSYGNGKNSSFSFIESDRAFHSIVYSTLGNSRLQNIWHEIGDETVWYGMMAMVTPERFPAVQNEHQAIIKSLTEGDVEAAHIAVRSHFEITAMRIHNILENKRLVYIDI